MDLTITNPVFAGGKEIPAKYTCDGENVSPPLKWREVPEETLSLVLICDDPDAPNGTWSHWVLYNIPPERDELPEGFAAETDLPQGRNDFGDATYGGPCPPQGPAHRYYFRLYALDSILELTVGATRQQVLDAMQDHIVAQAELMGRYARST